MPTLLELQRRFRDAVLAGNDGVVAAEVIGGGVGATARLAIYRHNVTGNLTRSLQISYPAIERLVGEACFAAMTQRFIPTCPPREANLNRYGAGLADFLTAIEGETALPYLADVARLEWAVNGALHACAAPHLTLDTLLSVPPEQQAGLRLVAHPTLSLLVTDYPARAIWAAVLIADADERSCQLADIDPDADGEALAVLRGDDGPEVRVLSDPAFALARALRDGCRLGEALAQVPPEDAAPLLTDMLASGFFTSMLRPEAVRPRTENARA